MQLQQNRENLEPSFASSPIAAHKHSRAKSRHIKIKNENTEMLPDTISINPGSFDSMSPNPIIMTKGSIVLQNQQYLLQRKVLQQVYGAGRIPQSHRRIESVNLSEDDLMSKIQAAKQMI